MREARLCDGAYRGLSIDAPGGLQERVTKCDGGYGRMEDHLCLTSAIERLTARERLILRLRFVEERTQSEIGALLGVSQMQVSRLLAAILRRLGTAMDAAAPGT